MSVAPGSRVAPYFQEMPASVLSRPNECLMRLVLARRESGLLVGGGGGGGGGGQIRAVCSINGVLDGGV